MAFKQYMQVLFLFLQFRPINGLQRILDFFLILLDNFQTSSPKIIFKRGWGWEKKVVKPEHIHASAAYLPADGSIPDSQTPCLFIHVHITFLSRYNG